MSPERAPSFELVNFRVFVLTAFAVAISLVLARAAESQQPTILAIGDESQVNSYTTLEQDMPAIAGNDEGDFVIVWQSDGADDTTVQSALAQRFDSAGQAVASEFRASFSTAADNSNPEVAMGSNGDFTIVWNGPNYSGQLVAGRRYASDGSSTSGVFAVSQLTIDDTGPPSVAFLPDGGFVVSWASMEDPPGGREVLARLFDSSGLGVGSPFQVNSYTTGDQEAPRIAADDAGDFVIVYESAEFTGETYRSIIAQRFDSTGTAIGDELLLAASDSGDSRDPDVDTLSDGFVVVWSGPGVIGDLLALRAFDSSGTPLGSLQLPAGTISSAVNPRVAADGQDQVIVTWSGGSDGDLRSILAQAYAPLEDGAPLSPAVQINVVTTGDQMQPAIAAVGDDFVIAWSSEASSGSDQDLTGIQRRAAAIPLFIDGFESQNLDAWSSTVP